MYKYRRKAKEATRMAKYEEKSPNAHKIFVRLCNLFKLTEDLIRPKNLSVFFYEDIAKTSYEQYMIYKFNQNIKLQVSGLIIQPNSFWLGTRINEFMKQENLF